LSYARLFICESQ